MLRIVRVESVGFSCQPLTVGNTCYHLALPCHVLYGMYNAVRQIEVKDIIAISTQHDLKTTCSTCQVSPFQSIVSLALC